MGARRERARRALAVGRVARRSGLRRVLAEIGVSGSREATREGARAFREGLEELGTTFIKLGQLLSSRPDLLPDVYIDELARLVDSVPPVPFAEIEAVIHEDLGADAFVSIDPEPLATASIAQTHRGLLVTGHDVVVKVRRPGVAEQVDLDLAVLRSTVRLVVAHSESARRIQLEELADELEVHLRAELDFVEEAHNTELIRGLVAEFEGLVVPQVIRPYVTERVLVLERIAGRKVERGARPRPRARRRARARVLPRVHPPGRRRRRLPRRPASREHPPHRRRPPRAARLRPARPARRGQPRAARAPPARDRPEPRGRRRRPRDLALDDDDELRPGRLRAGRPPEAAALPPPAARLDPGRLRARRPAALGDAARRPPADVVRARRQDARAGRLDRAAPRPRARSRRADRGAVARGDGAARSRTGSSRTASPRSRSPSSSRSRSCRAASRTSSPSSRRARCASGSSRPASASSSTTSARSRTGSAPR